MSKRSRVTTQVEVEDEDSKAVETMRAESARLAKKKPGRSWGFWLGSRLLVVTALLTVLAVFAPWIVGASGLWKPIFAWAAPEIAAKIELKSLNLGWFSGIDAQGIVVRDAAGQPLAEAARVSSQKSLLQIALNYQDLGLLTIEAPQATIVLRADGSNVEDFLASLPQSEGATPPIGFTLKIDKGAVGLDDQIAGRQWRLDNVLLDLAWPADAAAAKTGKLSAAVQPATLPAEGQPASGIGALAAEFSWQPTAAAAGAAISTLGSGSARLKLENLPTELTEGALRRFVADIRPHGALTIDGDYHWAGDAGSHHLVLRQLAAPALTIASADLLDEDRLELAIAKGAANVEIKGGSLAIKDLALESNLMQLTGRGEAELQSLSPAALFGSAATAGASDIQLSGQLNLPELARQLRHTLRLREGTEISSGTLQITLASKTGQGERRVEGSLRTDALRAIASGREIAMDQPVSLAAVVRQTPQGLVIEQLEGEANFLTLRGSGTLASGNVTAFADLDKLVGGLSQYMDLGNTRLAGTLSTNIKWSQPAGEAWTATADARVQRFELAAANLAPWKEADLQITAEAAGRLTASGLEQLDSGKLTISSAADRLEANLAEPVPEISAQTAWPLTFTLQGDLASWTPRLQAFVPLGDWRMAGAVDASGSGRFSPTAIELAATTVRIEQLAIDGPNVAIHEPIVKIDTTGAWDQPQTTLTLGSTTLASSSLAFRADGVRVKASATDPSVVGVIDFRGDLARLSSWIGSVETPRTWQAAGGMTGRVEIGYRGQLLEANWTADVENLAWLTPPAPPVAGRPLVNAAASNGAWQTQWTEPRASISGQGTYDPAKGTVQLARATLASSVVSLAAAGTLSELSGPCVIDLAGEISYDLGPIGDRIKSTLDPVGAAAIPAPGAGEGLVPPVPALQTLKLVGKEQRPFVLKGPLFATSLTPAGTPSSSTNAGGRFSAPGPATAHQPLISEALQGEASLAWQSAEFVGLIAGPSEFRAKLDQGIVRIGPVDIPISDGRLTTSPRVLLNDRIPAIVVDRGPLIENVAITPEMCHLWLKYVAPLLADATRAEGKLSVGLEGAAVPVFEPKKADVAGTLQIHTAQIGPGPLAQQYLALARQVRSLVDPAAAIAPADAAGEQARGWVILPEQAVQFEVVAGAVHHHGLTMQVKDVTITTEGTVGIEDQSINLLASIPISESWFKSGNGDRLKPLLSGKLIKIPIRGTLAAPKVDSKVLTDLTKQIAGSAVKGAVDEQIKKGQGLLQQELGKGLDKFFGPLRPQPAPAAVPVVPTVPGLPMP